MAKNGITHVQQLGCSLVCLLTLVAGCAGAEVNTRSPYPDVWEWVAPKKKGMELDDIGAALLTNGDVMVQATYRAPNGAKESTYGLFFDKAGFDNDKSDFTAARYVLHDGTELTYAPADERLDKHVFSDGTRVTTMSNGYHLCYRGPARQYLAVLDGTNKLSYQKVFFHLLSKPKNFVGGGGELWHGGPNTSCPDEGPLNLKIMVEPMPDALVSLPDDTFLMVDDDLGIVLRVKKDLNTPSILINDRIFAFDYHDDPFIVSELTGKSYGKPDDETAEITQQTYQAALNDFYRYLLTIRKNSSKRK